MSALRRLVVTIALLTGGLAAPAWSHEVRPALLQITESGPGAYDVLWKQPVVGDLAIRLDPKLSSGRLDGPPTRQTLAPGFLVREWAVRGGPPLAGQTVRVEGLEHSVTDVLVRVALADGAAVNAVLRPSDPSLIIAPDGPVGLAVPAYLRLGVEHILTGIDHLLFVLGLVLLIGPSWRVVTAVTAFTAAHSITLALAALELVKVSSPVVEALVALSIVFVARELLRSPEAPPTLARRYPWLIAFVFGLLHGLAFAGALVEVGLPKGAAPQALLLFNVGVELGQLVFIALAIGLMLILGWAGRRFRLQPGPLLRMAPAYAIGGCATYWLIERVMATQA